MGRLLGSVSQGVSKEKKTSQCLYGIFSHQCLKVGYHCSFGVKLAKKNCAVHITMFHKTSGFSYLSRNYGGFTQFIPKNSYKVQCHDEIDLMLTLCLSCKIQVVACNLFLKKSSINRLIDSNSNRRNGPSTQQM